MLYTYIEVSNIYLNTCPVNNCFENIVLKTCIYLYI